MSNRTGLTGAVVQRSLADWPVVLAAGVLLVCATTLLVTGVVYGDAVASAGLHRAILAAPPPSRAVQVSLASLPDGIERDEGLVLPAIRSALGAPGGDVIRVLKSGTFADASTPFEQVTDLTSFESVDGLDSHATLVAGAWPQGGRDPLETTLSEPAAAALGLDVGDRVSLASRQDPTVRVAITVVGIWRADPADGAWFGDPLETTGTTTVTKTSRPSPIAERAAIRSCTLTGISPSTGPRSRSWVRPTFPSGRRGACSSRRIVCAPPRWRR